MQIKLFVQHFPLIFRTRRCKHSAQNPVFHWSVPSVWMCVQVLGVCKLKKEQSQQEITLYLLSVELQQRTAQMAQSEKSLAVASGASRPDGEWCKYGLSHKKKKKTHPRVKDRHATFCDMVACVSLFPYWLIMKLGQMDGWDEVTRESYYLTALVELCCGFQYTDYTPVVHYTVSHSAVHLSLHERP